MNGSTHRIKIVIVLLFVLIFPSFLQGQSLTDRIVTQYYPSGQKMYEYVIHYVDTLHVTHFSVKGDTIEDYGWLKGSYDGVFKKFVKGKLAWQAHFRDRLLDGSFILYRSNQKIFYMVMFQQGCLLSAGRFYRNDGTLETLLVPGEARNRFVLMESINRKGETTRTERIDKMPETFALFGDKYHSTNCQFSNPED